MYWPNPHPHPNTHTTQFLKISVRGVPYQSMMGEYPVMVCATWDLHNALS